MQHQTASGRTKFRRIAAAGVAVIMAAAIAAGIGLFNRSAGHSGSLPVNLPTTPQSYLGVYAPGSPASYDGVTAFGSATGSRPDLVMYYSGWFVPFPAAFAATAAANSAVPLVQMDPDGISVAKIAAGRYDGYLTSYAESVRAYRHPVIVSFGHEMNGSWETWGYGHASPATFVAAWRHIVTLFRELGASNVTWLWTVNIIDDTQHPSPGPLVARQRVRDLGGRRRLLPEG
jgi:Glycosyl hydrolase family 26